MVQLQTNTPRLGCIMAGGKLVQIRYEVQGQNALVGGDMLIPISKILTGKHSPLLGLATETNTVRVWSNRRVPYTIPVDFPFDAEITHMVSEWAKAGVSWSPKTAEDNDYVSFEVYLNADYCGQSQLGRVGGKQIINMPQKEFATHVGCKMKHVILHETAHALGFMHEHQRSDRDSFVKFEGDITNATWLQKFANSVHRSDFDVASVTMYGTENTKPQIRKINGDEILLMDVLSAQDIAGAKIVYPVPTPASTPTPTATPTPTPTATLNPTPTPTAVAADTPSPASKTTVATEMKTPSNNNAAIQKFPSPSSSDANSADFVNCGQ